MATGGITLDGTSQYLEYTGGSVITAYPYSVLAWIASPLTLAGEEHVGGLGSTTADCFSGAHYNSLNDSKQAYDRSAATGTATATKTASPHINNTALQPILAVITSASSRTVYFANNTGTTDTFALSQTFTDFNRVTVGVAHRSSGYLQYMRGTVAEFHLYSTALTSSDFTTLLTTPPEDVTGWVDGWILSSNSDLTSIGGTRTLTAVGSPTTGSLTLPYTRGPVDYPITADQGSYTVSGQTASLLFNRLITAEQGSYTLTGQDATLTHGTPGAYSITCDSGTYTITGTDAYVDLSMNAEYGVYGVVGQDVTLTQSNVQSYSITAEQGTYSLSGQGTRLTWSNEVVTTNGIYTIAMSMRIGL